MGSAARAIAATRDHSHDHFASTMHIPRSQTTAIARENGSAAEAIAGELNTTLTAAMASLSGIDTRGHGSALPIALRTANGIRNFIDAANQTQYRTEAPLFLSISARAAASAPTNVDCQM